MHFALRVSDAVAHVQLDSTRLDSAQLDSTRFDSTQHDDDGDDEDGGAVFLVATRDSDHGEVQ